MCIMLPGAPELSLAPVEVDRRFGDLPLTSARAGGAREQHVRTWVLKSSKGA